VTDLNQHELDLKLYLEQFRDLRKTMTDRSLPYYGMEDFLLQHGVWYRPTGTPPIQGAPKSCFGNAWFAAVMHGVPYIEGMALAPRLPVPVHHAWNLDVDGKLADTTWMNEGLAYIGVQFSVGRADNATWFDDATVLDNPRDHHKIYRQPWTGENFNLHWRTSKPMRLLLKERNGGNHK
jgi:hypothetical protein